MSKTPKKRTQSPSRTWPRKLLVVSALLVGVMMLSAYPAYRIAKYAFRQYFESWGKRLVDLERRGLLSREYGAAWKDVLADDAMEREASRISGEADDAPDSVVLVDGVRVKDYPSLSIIRRLNAVQSYSNTIEITDRLDRRIALIRTNHTRGSVDEYPRTLITALIAAEDQNFRTNELGFEFDSYVRAALRALWESIRELEPQTPRGTSTITQQVAKLFISDLDELGRRRVSRSVERKIREMKIAAALRRMYTPDEILEVYLNHCVTSDYGLIGYRDIASGLLDKELDELTDAECIYLARMVKWGRNLHEKIARQARIDMPRMAAALGWDEAKQRATLRHIDSLTFTRPKFIHTDYGHLVDLANEFWLKALEKTGNAEADLADMDIIDPNSLIRRKGNLKIRLTIDLPLQRTLQRLVDTRGYGPDTVITTDVRVGSRGRDVTVSSDPVDTLRLVRILDRERTFSEPGSAYATSLQPGDSLITNIRYRRLQGDTWRRSVFYYARKKIRVDGQYYGYCILDSKTGKLLAYYSRDEIGSRLAGLLHRPVPNGSSTAKPIFNALNYDMGVFEPYAMWDDREPTPPDTPWSRDFVYRGEQPREVEFINTAVRGTSYKVHNHDYVFDGCQYVFEHLTTSNNILGVETVYRLNRTLFGANAQADPVAFRQKQFLYRIGAYERLKNARKRNRITGVRIYKELARIAGVDIDSMESYGRRAPISDSLYSVGLGTLELTLYEQAHLFNMLYDNNLIERPAMHPRLALESVELNGVALDLHEADTIRRYHPFSDINRIRPTLLGLHKRLVSNPADQLGVYDIPYAFDSTFAAAFGDAFNPDAYAITSPLSNYAKSGTTDDVLRPFNADVTSDKRTNYGHWNAVIRIDLAKVGGGSQPDIRDITLACIGECNQRYTGARDGKSLHKFVSRDLLRAFGQPHPDGFFTNYESYIRRTTPPEARACGRQQSIAEQSRARGTAVDSTASLADADADKPASDDIRQQRRR
jgi:hypothetical protein